MPDATAGTTGSVGDRLLASSARFARSAATAYSDEAWDVFYLHLATAVEQLVKAVLARAHPSFIADVRPNSREGFDSLLHLCGFGHRAAILLTGAFLWGVRHSPAAAVLVAAVIVGVVGVGAAFVGPRLIEGPCMGTSIEQAATSYSNLQDPSSGGLRLSLDGEFKAAGQDAELLGAAYRMAAVYDDDSTHFLKKRLCFPATVRSQVDALTAAVDARARVHRLLAGDPFNTDLLAQLSSSQETVTVATVELRRVLGLPSLSEPSTAPGS